MRLLKYLVIRATCKGSDNAIKVYNTLYPTIPNYIPVSYQSQEVKSSPVMVTNSPLKPNDKKQELIDSLNFLNSKKSKTKQDRESISMLESILKNMN